MANTNAPFTPCYGATYNATVSATATSSSVVLTAGSSSLRVVNFGTNPISIKTGLASAGAVTAVVLQGPVILSGTVEVFSIPPDHDTVAVITTTSTSTVYLTRGEGV